MIHPLSLPYNVVLGSASPRRKSLLTTIIPEFTVRAADVNEQFPDEMEAQYVPEFLALQKAEALRPSLQENELLITADTVVILGKEILNKPGNRDAACAMLKSLSGKSHQVITGICIMTADFEKTFQVKTKVRFESLTKEEIDFYIDTFQPFDKAGSYGIQEWIGHAGVSGIEGCYYNVVGLPVSRLYQELKQLR